MADKPFAYVCSPYKGDTEVNAARAREYSRKVFDAGYTPLAPHLLFPQFLNDNIPKERAAGMEMGIQLLANCRALVVCGNEITEGMAREIKRAEELRIPTITLAAISLLRDEPEKKRGAIYIFVANPDLRDPMGHVDRMLELPVTAEKFASELRSIRIQSPQSDRYYYHSLQTGDDILRKHLPRRLEVTGFDELNYFAAKFRDMSEDQRAVFDAALLSGRHCGSVRELINLTENLDRFELLPFHTAKQYGEHLKETRGKEHYHALDRLLASYAPHNRKLYTYILDLQESVDPVLYGLCRAEKENGSFSEYGYLRGRADFREVYRGPEDIPTEYRVHTRADKASVLDQIAAARAERGAAPEKTHRPRGPER